MLRILHKNTPSKLSMPLMYTFVFIAGLVWGVTFSLARITTHAGMHPLGLAWWQAAGGGAMLIIVCLLRRVDMRASCKLLFPMTVIGFAGSIIPGTLLFYAALHVPAGVLAITIALTPMLTYAACVVLKMDIFNPARATGVLLGFISIVLIMLPGNVEQLKASDSLASGAAGGSTTLWIALALLACCFYTIENIFVDKKVPSNIDMPLLLGGGMTIAALLMLPFVITKGAWVAITLPLNAAEWSVVAMVLFSTMAYLMFLIVIRHAGAVFASMTGYVVTLSGIFWGMLFFSEKHSHWIWLALVLMVLGMAMVTPRDKTTTPD